MPDGPRRECGWGLRDHSASLTRWIPGQGVNVMVSWERVRGSRETVGHAIQVVSGEPWVPPPQMCCATEAGLGCGERYPVFTPIVVCYLWDIGPQHSAQVLLLRVLRSEHVGSAQELPLDCRELKAGSQI